MKNINLRRTYKIAAILMLAVVTGCKDGNKAQSNGGEAEKMKVDNGITIDKMDERKVKQTEDSVATAWEPAFLVGYMTIKNALINDDYEKAKSAAYQMQKSLMGSELNEKQQNDLIRTIKKLLEAQDIEAQRQQFSALSRQLYQVVQKADRGEEKILYWQRCPMALNNQGANWLSYEEEVRNPFMGQKMVSCGSVEETIMDRLL